MKPRVSILFEAASADAEPSWNRLADREIADSAPNVVVAGENPLEFRLCVGEGGQSVVMSLMSSAGPMLESTSGPCLFTSRRSSFLVEQGIEGIGACWPEGRAILDGAEFRRCVTDDVLENLEISGSE